MHNAMQCNDLYALLHAYLSVKAQLGHDSAIRGTISPQQ